MESNLIEILKNKIGGRIARDGISVISLTEDETEQALDYIFPALLAMLVSKVSSESEAEELVQYLEKEGYDGSILDLMDNAFEGGPLTSLILDEGEHAATFLIGEDKNQYLNTISEFSQVSRDNIKKLTELVSPLFLSQLKQLINENKLNPKSVQSLLSEQKDIVLRQTPSKLFDKLELKKILNKENAESVQARSEDITETKEEAVSEKDQPSFGKIVVKTIPLIILLLFLVAGYIYLRNVSQGSTSASEVVNEVNGELKEKFDGEPIISWGLPNGYEVSAPESSWEVEVMKYLYGSTNDELFFKKGFILDDELVDYKKDSLSLNSSESLERLASIMKAYPDIEVKFNIYLPVRRAERKTALGNQLKSRLIRYGIPGERISWKAGPKETIGGNNEYKIELIVILPNQKNSSN